ncbi:MAG: ATP-binding cassette domain-containing protein [Bacilli bacterium]|nr:ATP-binding cassette domain-containing protein [Bacilli bacterium]
MLKLKNIKKTYKTGSFYQNALKGVNLEFRKNEFVAILGPSGSGKTTLLNIIGGLDNYDSGDLIINGKSTKKFKSSEWDAYRNNSVGFIFQSYNLIPHISILANIEMGLTLSGISSKKRKKKSLELLKQVGLKEHAHKKPNQLSGGQMQRVAIARALANDPDIILADEPTGALDTKTSTQIMNLIKEISKEKLVIMVTHNPDLAEEYATRIVKMQDGEIIDDTNPIKKEGKEEAEFKLKKTSMSFLTALKLSFNNIRTKKGRTALTAFASSIGIIGIALILSLSNGFKIEVDTFEQNSLAQSPIMITKEATSLDEKTLKKVTNNNLKKYPSKKVIYAQDDIRNTIMHTNIFTKEYLDYLDKIDKTKISGLTYGKATNLNIIRKDDEGYAKIEMPSNDVYQSMQLWSLLPENPNKKEKGVIELNYDILAGNLNEDVPGLILQLDNKNQITSSVLEELGITKKEVNFDEILNKEFKVAINNDYYTNVGDNYIPSQDYEKLYNSKNSITIKVNAIIRGKTGKEMVTNTSGLGYNKALLDKIISINKESDIVKKQQSLDYNILTHMPFDESENSTNTKDLTLGYLGADTYPVSIFIYPKDFDTKDYVTDYLDKYNKNKKEKDSIQYTDTAKMISTLTGGIMDAITIVLIAFSSISLIVSSIMIGIITYISVLERIKEIGILRALGARKKDIKRVFNAETFIIGILSGLLGIFIAYLLTYPVNNIIEELSGLANVAKLNPAHAALLILISMTLTIIGGAIPATIASRKDPVDALRTE